MNTGVVQNTPGGGVGGLGGTVGSGTGGTTVAAGGAGTGTLGLVSSTLGIGSTITSFDPQLTGTLQLDKNEAQSTSPFSPVPVIAQNTYTANFGYTQGFAWGGALTGVFNNTHLTTNNTTSLLTPQLGSNFQFRFTQNLLQGFGFLPNTRFIRIAKNNREISDVAFRLQVITTVDQIENMYWDLVYAFENCARTAGSTHLRTKGSGRCQTAGASRNRASDSGRERAEHRGYGPAESHRRPEQSATATVADEECAQPEH